MNLHTKRFGPIEINEEMIVRFHNGIPGFEDLKLFVLIQESVEHPYAYMQSVEDGDVSFIIVNPFAFVVDYEFDLDDAVLSELGIQASEDLQIWTLMSIANSLETATVNLLAPIVINIKLKIGKQVILHDTDYMTKHPLFMTGG